MKRDARFDLIIIAIGEPLTKFVRIFTGSPRKLATVPTLLSAEVTCMRKTLDACTGCPSSGEMRIPMLVGMTIDHLASSRSFI